MAVRSGYPPQSLTIVPELPISSLGLKQGDQIIVSQKSGTAVRAPSSPPKLKTAAPAPSRIPAPAPASGSALSVDVFSKASSNAAQETSEPDSVATEGGFLVHRVSLYMFHPAIALCIIDLHGYHICIRCR